MLPIREAAFAARHRGGTRERRIAAVVLVFTAPLLFPVYSANVNLGSAPETLSAALTAHSLLREGNLDLNEYFEDADSIEDWRRYSLPEHDGRLLSMEPVVSSLTFVPFLVSSRDVARQRWHFRAIGQRAAAQVAIVAIVLLGLWLLSVTSIPRALVATVIIALATNHLTTLGSGLWSHTSAVLWLVAGLFLWSSAPARPTLYPLAAVALALATACRPILAPVLVAVTLDAWGRDPSRRLAAWTAVVIGILAAAIAAANGLLYGSLFGGRAGIVANVSVSHGVPAYFALSPVHWAGLLVSPSRGLFVYSPVLLFAMVGMGACLRAGAPTPLRWMTLAGIASFACYGVIATWWGGWVFGPRYLTDLLPFLGLWLALTPLPTRWRPAWIALFVLLLGWSLFVQLLGVSRYPCGWNREPASIDHDHARLWDWHDSQIRRCLEAPPRDQRRGAVAPR